MSPESPDVLCYSVRLVRPFVALLRGHPKVPAKLLRSFDALDPDERIPVQTVHKLLEGAETLTGDPLLGLRAIQELALGDLGAVDYALSTASSVEESLTLAVRFGRLLNDAMRFFLEVKDGRAEVRLDSVVAFPRAAAEFQLGSVLLLRQQIWPEALSDDLDVFFTHPAPEDLTLYHRVFAPGRLHFDSPFRGFAFDARHLKSPLRAPDPKLHAVMRKHVELVLGSLPRVESLSERVRGLLVRELAGGNPNAVHIAHLLHMSLSTLSRRLEREGTTFSAILEELRMQLAMNYLTSPRFSIPEIAILTGFSQAGAFHRAFRRWTSKTPLQYRRERLSLGTLLRRAGGQDNQATER